MRFQTWFRLAMRLPAKFCFLLVFILSKKYELRNLKFFIYSKLTFETWKSDQIQAYSHNSWTISQASPTIPSSCPTSVSHLFLPAEFRLVSHLLRIKVLDLKTFQSWLQLQRRPSLTMRRSVKTPWTKCWKKSLRAEARQPKIFLNSVSTKKESDCLLEMKASTKYYKFVFGPEP